MSDESAPITAPIAPATSPFELFAGLDPTASLEGSLHAIAERLRETFDVDIVVLRAQEEDRRRIARGFSTDGPELSRSLGAALAAFRPETADLGLTSLRGGTAVIWSDLSTTPAVLARLAEIEDRGIDVTAAREAVHNASCVAMPLRTPGNPALGAVGMINLSGRPPIGQREKTALEALAPQISLAVQNALLRDRHDRTRQVMEALLATTQNGVLVIDNDGMISLVNRAYGELLRIPSERLQGQPAARILQELVRPRFADPETFERIAVRLEGRHNVTLRDQLETVDGRVLERFSAPVRDSDGRMLGRVVILSDITVRHRALMDARSLAEENAELLQREEERAQEEITIARAAHLLASALTLADIHELLVEQIEALIPGTRVVLFDVRHRGDILAVASRGFPADANLSHLRARRGSGIAGRVAESRRTLICHDVLQDPTVILSPLESRDTRSLVALPLELADRAYGVLAVYSPETHAFDERMVRVLSELGQHAEAALQNALLFEHERGIAEGLQDALLAEEPPVVPGLELATLYRAAGGTMVGGDVHNVWMIGPDLVAVLVGDVAGKGIPAAGTTGMVRFMLEGLAVGEQDPAALLDQLSHLVAHRLGDAAFVTAFLGIIDLSTNELTWTNAGHTPPMIIRPDGASHTLEEPDPPLGFLVDEPYHAHREPFDVGSLLVVTTDGITEAGPAEDMFGEERFDAAVRDLATLPVHDIATGIYRRARQFANAPLNDDVALAVVRRVAEPAPRSPLTVTPQSA